MASAAFEHVWKKFGETIVVRDISLKIDDGDFVVLVGPSGCGKTTTLRMLAGLEKASEGVIRIGDKDVSNLSPRDRDTAMVFQSYALYPHMTVFENMAFGLRLRKLPDAEINKRVGDAAEMLGLTDYLQRKPKALSGGQRQRVAMGRAIVRQPSVYLFDEPLSNLDAKLRVQMRAEIARLHQRLGVTTVYVTHDQVEAMTLAKRIVVMKDGVLQQVGAPLELYRRPQNVFVAGFMGSPSMNFVPVEVGSLGKDPVVKGQGFQLLVPERFRATLPAAGSKLTLGIRPEHVHPAKAAPPDLVQVVEVVEPLGSVVHVLGTVSGAAFTSAVPPESPVKSGDKLGLAIDVAELHLFDAGGQSLARIAA